MTRWTWFSLVLVAAIAHPCFAQCGPSWSSRFHNVGLDSGPRALAVFDEDGDGPLPPRLFGAGSFIKAGGRSVNSVGRWDGVSWSQLGGDGGGVPGLVGTVNSMLPFDPDGDGPLDALLVFGGTFLKTRENLACPGIVAWTGSAFQALGTLANSTVEAMVVHDFDGDGGDPPVLVISGYLNLPGFGTSGGVFTFDGTTIAPLTAWIPQQPGNVPSNLVSWTPMVLARRFRCSWAHVFSTSRPGMGRYGPRCPPLQ